MKLKELYVFIRPRLNANFDIVLTEDENFVYLKIGNKNFKGDFLIKNTDDMVLLKERAEVQILKHLNGRLYK